MNKSIEPTLLGKLLRTPMRQVPARAMGVFRRTLFVPGYHWGRIVMDRDIEEYVLPLGPAELDAVEISGALHAGRGWRTFTELSFPEFDICKAETLPGRQFDVVICEQVLEHVVDPTTAMRNLAGLCRSSGHVVVGTPFLVRVHGHPGDYWRWTPDGLRLLIENSGLKVEEVRSWGNRRCIRANFYVWAGYRPWHSLRNETDLPMHVWSFARKPS